MVINQKNTCILYILYTIKIRLHPIDGRVNAVQHAKPDLALDVANEQLRVLERRPNNVGRLVNGRGHLLVGDDHRRYAEPKVGLSGIILTIILLFAN